MKLFFKLFSFFILTSMCFFALTDINQSNEQISNNNTTNRESIDSTSVRVIELPEVVVTAKRIKND